MRITIDTDDPAGARTPPAQVASDLHPALDAGAAPIEHIRRMSSVAGAQAHGADFSAQAPSIEHDSAVDGGRSSHPAASRSGDGDKAQDLPLNPLRAGAALALAQRSALAPKHESSVAATDAGSASAVTARVEPPASKRAQPLSAKAVKTQSKP